jgi:ABC-type phosphonate transport system ATPase subunit
MTADGTPEATGPPAAIEARGLRRTFGATVAVDGIDLTVPEGVLYGLIGPDGAGKSTLLRMLATVLRPDAGEATVFGASVVHEPNRVTSQIGYMSQQFCLYPDLRPAPRRLQSRPADASGIAAGRTGIGGRHDTTSRPTVGRHEAEADARHDPDARAEAAAARRADDRRRPGVAARVLADPGPRPR